MADDGDGSMVVIVINIVIDGKDAKSLVVDNCSDKQKNMNMFALNEN